MQSTTVGTGMVKILRDKFRADQFDMPRQPDEVTEIAFLVCVDNDSATTISHTQRMW